MDLARARQLERVVDLLTQEAMTGLARITGRPIIGDHLRNLDADGRA